MKLFLIHLNLFLLISIASGQAGMRDTSFSKANNLFPVDNFLSYELCCKTQKYPIAPGTYLKIHKQLQVYCDSNSMALSVSGGKVHSIVKLNNWVFMIDHGSHYSVYRNLKNTSLKEGQKIKKGHVIAKVDAVSLSSQLTSVMWLEY